MLETGNNSKTKLIVSALVAVFFLAPVVSAELKFFPKWELRACPTEEFACYDFETSQKILLIDIDLQLDMDRLDMCLKDAADLKLSFKKLNDANTLLHGNIERLDLRLKEKDKVLTDNTNLMVKYQSRDVLGGALPWVVAIVVVIAAGAFAGGYYTGSR